MSDILKEIKNWFKIAVPEPTEDNKQIELGFLTNDLHKIISTHTLLIDKDCRWVFTQYVCNLDLLGISKNFKECRYKLYVTGQQYLAKSLAKIIFDAVGLAHMHGIDIEGALQEINRSNWSKFENGKPVFDENGKITKGKDYTPPDLSQFVRE